MKESPKFELLDTTEGVLTQIDNMICCLVREKPAQPEQEPVAWMHVQGNYKEPSFRELANDEVERGWEQHPLYNTPPQREWQSLTDDEIKEIIGSYAGQIKGYTRELFDKIDAKLREKNT
jgi:hypothetical protein